MAMLSIFFFIFFVRTANSLEFCKESCSRTGQVIRFPFGLTEGRCSYPGFNLSCSSHGQTIITLPRSGDFIVQFIDYSAQAIHIQDPGNCLAERFYKNFSLSGTPFVKELDRSFTFVNCSSNSSTSSFPSSSRQVHCLSNDYFIVVAIPNSYDGLNFQPPSSCAIMDTRVEVPVMWHRYYEEATALTWVDPDCKSCERQGGTCGFKDNFTLEIGCYDLPTSNKHALPRSAKYGIIIGIGIPGLLCIIGIGCFLCGRIRTYRRRLLSRTELTSTFPHTPSSIAVAGLDGPTIDLYPKTLLGESRRLPKPNDNTCPICLSEYQPKETLRTIPECNHYFHADCIDEWLKMNATCPLCRNSPSISSRATPSSSLSASSAAAAAASSLLSASSSSLSSGP